MSDSTRSGSEQWQQAFSRDDFQDMLTEAQKTDPTIDHRLERAVHRRRFLHSLPSRRKASQKSQDDIAKAMGTSQPSIARLERGEIDPRLSTLDGYADALNIDLATLFRPDSTDGQDAGAQSARELIDRGAAALNAHDSEALASLYDANVVSIAPGPGGQVEGKGREAVREYSQTWFDAFPDARVTIHEWVGTGTSIAQEGSFEGTQTGTLKTGTGDMPATGKKVRAQYVLLWKVADGLIVSSKLYFDQVQLLMQVGLIPSPQFQGGPPLDVESSPLKAAP